jgi:hypothetical protein
LESCFYVKVSSLTSNWKIWNVILDLMFSLMLKEKRLDVGNDETMKWLTFSCVRLRQRGVFPRCRDIKELIEIDSTIRMTLSTLKILSRYPTFLIFGVSKQVHLSFEKNWDLNEIAAFFQTFSCETRSLNSNLFTRLQCFLAATIIWVEHILLKTLLKHVPNKKESKQWRIQ